MGCAFDIDSSGLYLEHKASSINPQSSEPNSPTLNLDAILAEKGNILHPVLKSQSDSDTDLLKESGYNPTDLKVFKDPLEIDSKNPSTNPSVNSIQSIHFQNFTIAKKKNPKSFSVDPGSMSYKPLSVRLEEVAFVKKSLYLQILLGNIEHKIPKLSLFNDDPLSECKRFGKC